MSRPLLIALLFASLTVAACSSNFTSPAQPGVSTQAADANGPAPQFTVDTYVDYGLPGKASDLFTATSETDSFSLIQGGLHWNAGDPVPYGISGTEGASGGNAAIQTAVGTIDSYVTPRTFTFSGTPPNNPCGLKNEIVWEAIDGPGNVLASTSTCRNVATKEIVGFLIRIDSGDAWTTSGESGKFDVQNIITHEMGHAAGLGHDNSPRDGCLTMYKFSTPEETQKRTLGLGDKLGMKKLYNSSDIAAGTCGT